MALYTRIPGQDIGACGGGCMAAAAMACLRWRCMAAAVMGCVWKAAAAERTCLCDEVAVDRAFAVGVQENHFFVGGASTVLLKAKIENNK